MSISENEEENKTAVKWYLLAATAGNTKSKLRLAELYESGTGVEKNLLEAKHWYEKAAYDGNLPGMLKYADYLSRDTEDEGVILEYAWLLIIKDRVPQDSINGKFVGQRMSKIEEELSPSGLMKAKKEYEKIIDMLPQTKSD